MAARATGLRWHRLRCASPNLVRVSTAQIPVAHRISRGGALTVTKNESGVRTGIDTTTLTFVGQVKSSLRDGCEL
ncbi:hypothetical protein B0H17DRAFT_1077512 [Mycena rosella]|uniref:Uncharacterized protein n=1 Tax=Mycena rosella TaxID=1033263 RepID=A0AAD7D596_MYCRO|nr:hypothetical protein B0H17DRAFT_1077512 [Mycena rosella]